METSKIMNRILIILLLISNLSCFSQTQTEMNKTANEEYIKTDSELNSLYQQILDEYKSDIVFIDRLKKTQRIWIAYRDAELKMKFPAKNKQLEYGSAYPMCVSIFLKELTEERIDNLKFGLAE